MKQKRWYDTPRWRKARRWFLSSHPLCEMCRKSGRVEPAIVVDHIEPHNNNYNLFWDVNNWQGLCASCHSGVKRMEDTHGYSQAAGADGLPLDIKHPWNRGKHEGKKAKTDET